MRNSRPLVALPTTEQHTLVSSDGGRAYRVFVALPHAYDTSRRSYPVIYVLDGNSLFPIMTETVRLLHFYSVGVNQWLRISIALRPRTR